ncbi:hypothetical protein HPP92_024650 [Vanilla planifolia]|nr:hypothetical protein HPP92_024650 [Vanilla planifolia]
MEGEEGSQQPQLVLAHKLFLLKHPDVEDIDKVRLRDEVLAAIKADDMASLYESLSGASLLTLDAALLEFMRKRIDEETKTLDDK